MGKHSPVAAAPRYMQSFHCVGDACPENCCTGWTVTIDKPTFQRYRSVRIEPLAEMLATHVHRSPEGAPGYAQINMRADKACPFLDERKLCQIHGQLGEQALSRTCTDYPRQYIQDGERLALHATLSCPEAARLALSDPRAMDPVDLTLGFANEQLVPFHVRRGAVPAGETDPVRKHRLLLGQVAEALIRVEGLSAAESLVMVGLLLRRIGRIDSQGEAAELELAEAIEYYLSPAQLAEAPALVRTLSVSRPLQLDLLLSTTQRYASTQVASHSFRQLIDDVWAGLRCAEGLAVAAEQLAHVEQTQFRAFEQAHPHVLKNYLLNEFGLALFPRGGAAELEREFMAIALRFALIKLYACGLAAQRGADFSSADVVRAAYVVTRSISHNRRFLPDLLQTLAEQDALRLDVLTTLIL